MATYDQQGGALLRTAQEAAEYRTASPRAQHLSQFTGFVARDIDTISAFCAGKGLLIVSRCPDFNANGYISEVKSGEYRMKPGHIKKKTGAHGLLLWGGRGYVSDYDLMCVHRMMDMTGKYDALDISWDGKSPKTAVEEEIIGALNRRLVFKIQHGCNDCYVSRWADGSNPVPKVKDIGDEFIVFRNNEVWPVMSRFDLKTKVYDRYGLSGWHPIYGC